MTIANKFFVNPFGVAGDKDAVPDTVQIGGSVSYAEGWGFDYQRDLATDAEALAIPRTQSNQLLYDVTLALKQYQTFGIPNFITSVQNLGVAYEYNKYAMAAYDDGVNGVRIFQSLSDTNTALPTDTTKWRWVDDSTGAIIYTNGIVFDGAVNDGDAVYLNDGDGKFYQAIADGSVAQNVVGIADVTFNRVYAAGYTPLFSGLTPGGVYVLSSSVAGAITTVRPSVDVVPMGVAKSATALFLSMSIVVPTINVVVFTSSGTYTPSADMRKITVEVQAAGGGGGGCAAGSSSTSAAAGGGGGGGYARSLLLPADVGGSLPVTIGAAGTGGAAGANDGGAASDTTFGPITCGGGKGGAGSFAGTSPTGNQPGQGGSATGGNILNIHGSDGSYGFFINNVLTVGGCGGGSTLGSAEFGTPNAAPPSGNNYGGGGPGSFRNGSLTSALAGGDGAPGIVIITEYIGS